MATSSVFGSALAKAEVNAEQPIRISSRRVGARGSRLLLVLFGGSQASRRPSVPLPADGATTPAGQAGLVRGSRPAGRSPAGIDGEVAVCGTAARTPGVGEKETDPPTVPRIPALAAQEAARRAVYFVRQQAMRPGRE